MLSPDVEFDHVGGKSGINYRRDFNEYKKVLIKMADNPHIKAIVQMFNDELFPSTRKKSESGISEEYNFASDVENVMQGLEEDDDIDNRSDDEITNDIDNRSEDEIATIHMGLSAPTITAPTPATTTAPAMTTPAPTLITPAPSRNATPELELLLVATNDNHDAPAAALTRAKRGKGRKKVQEPVATSGEPIEDPDETHKPRGRTTRAASGKKSRI